MSPVKIGRTRGETDFVKNIMDPLKFEVPQDICMEMSSELIKIDFQPSKKGLCSLQIKFRNHQNNRTDSRIHESG